MSYRERARRFTRQDFPPRCDQAAVRLANPMPLRGEALRRDSVDCRLKTGGVKQLAWIPSLCRRAGSARCVQRRILGAKRRVEARRNDVVGNVPTIKLIKRRIPILDAI